MYNRALSDANLVKLTQDSVFHWQCRYCPRWFIYETEIVRHIQNIHYKHYSCDKCNFVTNNARQLTKHKVTIHKLLHSYICSDCGLSYAKRSIYFNHIYSKCNKRLKDLYRNLKEVNFVPAFVESKNMQDLVHEYLPCTVSRHAFKTLKIHKNKYHFQLK